MRERVKEKVPSTAATMQGTKAIEHTPRVPQEGLEGQAQAAPVIDLARLCQEHNLLLSPYSVCWEVIKLLGMEDFARGTKGFFCTLEALQDSTWEKYCIFYRDGMDRETTERVIYHEIGHFWLHSYQESEVEIFSNLLYALARQDDGIYRKAMEENNGFSCWNTRAAEGAREVWQRYGMGQKAPQGPGTAGSRIIYPSFGKPLERALSAGRRQEAASCL